MKDGGTSHVAETAEGGRPLALWMLLLGLTGQLAYAAMVYHASSGQQNSAFLPGLAWLRYLPWACWAVLLVRRGVRRWAVGLLSFLAVVVFVFASETVPATWFAPSSAEHAHRAEGGAQAGDRLEFPALSDVDGNAFQLSGYDDRPVVLNLWRSWCAPCRAEVPDLEKLEGMETAIGPIVVIGLNDEPLSIQKKARTELGIEYRLVKHESTDEAE